MRQIYEGKKSALNELDKEMEARGLEFVRYADDCIIIVGSEMAAYFLCTGLRIIKDTRPECLLIKYFSTVR